jgi:hypothetical protein
MSLLRPLQWKLVDRRAVPVDDTLEWARWIKTADRSVAKTEVGPLLVSTVFLGLDHQYSTDPKAPPLLFETMIFQGDARDLDCRRYSTWEEAEQGHAQMVEHARQLVD